MTVLIYVLSLIASRSQTALAACFSLAVRQTWLRFLCSTSPSSGWTPLGRGSDGRFGLRRFRAKHKPEAFGTRRAFPHTLPPSFALRFVPLPVSPCFFSLPLK